MNRGTFPRKQGLYDPVNEHDACGVGFVADIKGRKSHKIVQQGLQILERLTHRGAVGADPKAGDGAGILLQIPDEFFRSILDFELPVPGKYGVGVVFLPGLHLYDPSAYEPGSTHPFHYLGGEIRSEWLVEETEIQRRLRSWAHATQVPFLDLTPRFREAAGGGARLHHAFDGHWNAEGHRLAAEGIAAWIREARVFGELLP